MDMDFAKKSTEATAATGLGFGIAGATLGLLNNGGGILGNLLGGGCNAVCSENMPVNRYELGQQKTITEKDMEIAYLRGRNASKEDDLELYKYVDGRFRGIHALLSLLSEIEKQS